MRGHENVHTDSDAYNSQIMAQIVQSEDMTSRVKNPMLILAHKKISVDTLYKNSVKHASKQIFQFHHNQ